MLLIDAANVSGGGAILLEYLVDHLLRRQVPFHVLKKSSVVLPVSVQNYTDTTVSLLNRRAVLRACIGRVNPTTLLCFGNFPPPFRTHVRTITYVHNLHYLNGHDERLFGLRDKIRRNLRRTYLRANLRHSDVFVVQTPYVQRLFVETYGVASQSVQVLPFYNEERIRAVADAQPTEGADMPAGAFLYASGSEPHKNHVNLLRAWQLLHQQGISPTLYLTVSPESSYSTPALLKQIETLKQAGVAVENLGYVPYDDLLRLTVSCAACVFPSVNETVGLGLLEAYWLGNDILAGRRPYLAYVIKPSAQFDPYDPTDIADAVKQQLSGTLPKPELMLHNQIDAFVELCQQPANAPKAPLIKLNAIDFYNAIAPQFDNRYESSRAFVERYRVWTELFSRHINSTDHVMDLGCGSGVFSSYLAETGCVVTGVDGSAEMIKLCNQKKTVGSARYVVQSLPLSNPADYAAQHVIIASSLLEYIDDVGRMLEQIHAMLKPNGLLIVSMPNRLSLYRRIERRLFALTGYPRYFAHIRHVSTDAIFNQQLTNLGFEVLETKHFSGYDPLSRLLKQVLPKPYVNNLFVGVYRQCT